MKTIEKCWCGHSVVGNVISGVWQGESFTIGHCVQCGTNRTVSVTNNNFLPENYLYEELSHRHYCSMQTIEKFVFRKDEGARKSVLEIGCNTGAFLRLLASRYPDLVLTGQDFNSSAVNRNVHKGIKLTDRPINEIDGVFDLIILMHVLEHIDDLSEFFREIGRIAATSSFIYICVPNFSSFNYLRQKQNWGALNPVDHNWHFTNKSIIKVLSTLCPEWSVVHACTSWIWPTRSRLFNKVFSGDQLEVVLKR